MTVDQVQESRKIGDSISSIKRSALRFLSGTMLSRISGMLRDMVLAFCFGTHEALATLLVAFRLSHVCRRLFGEGALQSSFIPAFEELRRERPLKAFTFFRDLTCSMTLFLLGFILVSMFGLICSLHMIEFKSGNRQIVEDMIILMPSLLFICLFGLNSSLLQCQKRYFTVGIAPTFFNICICLGSLLFIGTDPTVAMPYVAVFIVFGCLFQWLVTFVPALKTTKNELDGKLTQGIQFLSPDIRRFATPLALGMLGVGASQINNTVDALFAHWADPQGPAQLWYALRLVQLPLTLFGIALSGALLPPLSRSIQAGRKEEYLRFIDFTFRRVFAFLVPCTIALFVFGIPIVNLIFGRGSFQLDSIISTCICLQGYALGLLPMGLIIVLAPAFYAYKDLKTPARGAFLSLFLNFILNCLFVFVFGMKALSITLATSISSWVNVFYLYNRLQAHLGDIVTSNGKKELIKLGSASLLAGVATWCFESYFYLTPSIFYLFVDKQIALVQNIVDQIFVFAVPALFYLVSLLFFAWLIKANDILVLVGLKKEDPVMHGDECTLQQ